jgi:hypothetical protein
MAKAHGASSFNVAVGSVEAGAVPVSVPVEEVDVEEVVVEVPVVEGALAATGGGAVCGLGGPSTTSR